MNETDVYPPIGDYGLIGDCHSAALVSRGGSVDWACMPRIDSPSIFCRLLDWEAGGYLRIFPSRPGSVTRRYVPGTLVLETEFRTGGGRARVTDCFTMRKGGARDPHQQLLRVIEGLEGEVELDIEVVARFVYGTVRPLIRAIDRTTLTLLGSDSGLILTTDLGLAIEDRHDLRGTVTVGEGDRRRLSLVFDLPEEIDAREFEAPTLQECDARLEETIQWWHRWRRQRTQRETDQVIGSAIVLKALTNAPTGAVVAAPTTSLPEQLGGSRNWDYRFSWIRDSWLTLRALSRLGLHAEAEGFSRFIERSASGSGRELQVMYGLGGERDLYERELDHLQGYRGSGPVRIGNRAYRQRQHDMFGELLEVAWLTRQGDGEMDHDYWIFLCEVIEEAAEVWADPDRGIWEIRGDPRHFVFSKAMCWVALDRGVQLARYFERSAPVERWGSTAETIRREVLERGFSSELGTFTQAFDGRELDSSVLLLPLIRFIEPGDPRMRSTVDAVMKGLDEDGLLRRYTNEDGLTGAEGVFLSCTFWLVECLVLQGRLETARRYFDRALGTANDLGLFSEEYDPREKILLGNFPQSLTHLSHLTAALALEDAAEGKEVS